VDVSGFAKLDEIRSISSRRCVSTLARGKERGPILVINGGVEDILRLSSSCEDAPKSGRSTTRFRADLDGTFSRRSDARVSGAWNHLQATTQACSSIAKKAEGRRCRCRNSRPFTIRPRRAPARHCAAWASWLRREGGEGDNELVAEQRLVGSSPSRFGPRLNGAQLQAMATAVSDARVEETRLFCRVTPGNKNRIIWRSSAASTRRFPGAPV
jgi:hypothetical protein